MATVDYKELLAVDVGAEAFVRQALELLENRTRELALLAVGEWEQLGLAGFGDLLPVVASLEEPTWGTWNGLLEALHAARERRWRRERRRSGRVWNTRRDWGDHGFLGWAGGARRRGKVRHRGQLLARRLGRQSKSRIGWVSERPRMRRGGAKRRIACGG